MQSFTIKVLLHKQVLCLPGKFLSGVHWATTRVSPSPLVSTAKLISEVGNNATHLRKCTHTQTHIYYMWSIPSYPFEITHFFFLTSDPSVSHLITSFFLKTNSVSCISVTDSSPPDSLPSRLECDKHHDQFH